MIGASDHRRILGVAGSTAKIVRFSTFNVHHEPRASRPGMIMRDCFWFRNAPSSLSSLLPLSCPASSGSGFRTFFCCESWKNFHNNEQSLRRCFTRNSCLVQGPFRFFSNWFGAAFAGGLPTLRSAVATSGSAPPCQTGRMTPRLSRCSFSSCPCSWHEYNCTTRLRPPCREHDSPQCQEAHAPFEAALAPTNG